MTNFSHLAPSVAETLPRTLRSAGVTGLGFYVPERIVTNDDLARFLDTNDEWIRSRTGIGARRIVSPEQTTVDIAEIAARRALEDAKLNASDIQMVIVATCTPDYQFPSSASLLQHRLGVAGAAFDMGAACSGFVYALVTAAQFVGSGACENILVVGAEVMSRVLDWNDRSSCVLFGDGAGAVVVSKVEDGTGVLGFDLGSDGSGGPLLKLSIDGEPAPLRIPDGKNEAASTLPQPARNLSERTRGLSFCSQCNGRKRRTRLAKVRYRHQ